MPAYMYVSLMQQRNPSLANKSKTVLQQNYFSKYDEYVQDMVVRHSLCPNCCLIQPAEWLYQYSPFHLGNGLCSLLFYEACPSTAWEVCYYRPNPHIHTNRQGQYKQSSQSVPIQVHALVIGRLQIQIPCVSSGVRG